MQCFSNTPRHSGKLFPQTNPTPMSRDSSVGTVTILRKMKLALTGYELDYRGSRAQNVQNRWGPPSLLSNGHQGLLNPPR